MSQELLFLYTSINTILRLPSILSFLLLPFSIIYGWITSVRNFLYDRKILDIYQAAIPLISVGNLSTGGTGKTPMAEYLIRYFQQKGIQAAYLSRGYGRKTKGYFLLDPQKGSADTYGDEALQIAVKFPDIPVAVSEDRRIGIQKLLEQKPQLIILDDAFQHRKVARDLDLLLIDANRLPYKDFILPSGSLRESIRSIRRADILLVNKISSDSQIKNIGNKLSKWGKKLAFSEVVHGGPIAFGEEKEGIDIAALKTKEVILFSGIGNPDFFEAQMITNNWKIKEHLKFGDHHDFSSKDIDRILQARTEESICICTEKDYQRLRGKDFFNRLSSRAFYYLPIQLNFLAGEASLLEMLEQLNLNQTQDTSR